MKRLPAIYTLFCLFLSCDHKGEIVGNWKAQRISIVNRWDNGSVIEYDLTDLQQLEDKWVRGIDSFMGPELDTDETKSRIHARVALCKNVGLILKPDSTFEMTRCGLLGLGNMSGFAFEDPVTGRWTPGSGGSINLKSNIYQLQGTGRSIGRPDEHYRIKYISSDSLVLESEPKVMIVCFKRRRSLISN